MVQQKRIYNVRFLKWWKEEGQEGTLELWLPRREWCQAGRVDSCLLHWWGVGCCKGGTGGGWEVAVVESDLLQRWRVGCPRGRDPLPQWWRLVAAVVEGVLPQRWRWVAAAVGDGLLQWWRGGPKYNKGCRRNVEKEERGFDEWLIACISFLTGNCMHMQEPLIIKYSVYLNSLVELSLSLSMIFSSVWHITMPIND